MGDLQQQVHLNLYSEEQVCTCMYVAAYVSGAYRCTFSQASE